MKQASSKKFPASTLFAAEEVGFEAGVCEEVISLEEALLETGFEETAEVTADEAFFTAVLAEKLPITRLY
jgi:hypothetical protein